MFYQVGSYYIGIPVNVQNSSVCKEYMAQEHGTDGIRFKSQLHHSLVLWLKAGYLNSFLQIPHP